MSPRARISESSLPLDPPSGAQDVTEHASWRPWGLGIDCHSRFYQVCLLLPDYAAHRVRRLERSVPASRDALLDARAWVGAVLQAAALPTEPFRYTLESTGCYHLPIVLAWQGRPSIINPLLAGPSRRKTDVLDARTLAYHSLTGLWPDSYVPPLAVQELRALARARRTALTTGHRHLLSIGALLLTWGHTLTALGSLADGAVRPVVEDLVAGRAPGGDLLQHVSAAPFPESVAALIRDNYAAYDAARARARQLQKAVLEGIKRLSWPVLNGTAGGEGLLGHLQSIPGVGPQTASTWLLEAGDVTRFPRAKAAVAYAGFDPSLKVSAGKVTQHIRRKGNAVLHRVFIQAAQSVLARNREPIGRWGHAIRLKHARGGHAKAVGAVARRLVQCAYHVTLHNAPFDPSGYRSLDPWRATAVSPTDPPPSPPGPPDCSSAAPS